MIIIIYYMNCNKLLISNLLQDIFKKNWIFLPNNIYN